MQRNVQQTPEEPSVALIRWPDEEARLVEARGAGWPRLILVSPGAEPPGMVDPLEDWVRLPAPDTDVRVRVRTLQQRAADMLSPHVEDGVIAYGDSWVPVSPVEERLAAELCEYFGVVVSRPALVRAAWPDDPPSRNALDVHVLRLRRRIEPLGLEIRTVRSRGYVLQSSS